MLASGNPFERLMQPPQEMALTQSSANSEVHIQRSWTR